MTKNNPLVSCIVPSYKRCDTLRRAIDSIISQTYKNLEVLIVNDNENGDEYSKELSQSFLSTQTIIEFVLLLRKNILMVLLQEMQGLKLLKEIILLCLMMMMNGFQQK